MRRLRLASDQQADLLCRFRSLLNSMDPQSLAAVSTAFEAGSGWMVIAMHNGSYAQVTFVSGDARRPLTVLTGED